MPPETYTQKAVSRTDIEQLSDRELVKLDDTAKIMDWVNLWYLIGEEKHRRMWGHTDHYEINSGDKS